MNKLWVRWGDNAEYEETSLDTIRDELAHMCTWPCDLGKVTAGLTVSRFFEGNNYVSLYWGDDEAQWYRDLSAQEFESIGVKGG